MKYIPRRNRHGTIRHTYHIQSWNDCLRAVWKDTKMDGQSFDSLCELPIGIWVTNLQEQKTFFSFRDSPDFFFVLDATFCSSLGGDREGADIVCRKELRSLSKLTDV